MISLILIASIKGNSSTILCIDSTTCGQKFKDYLANQKTIIAINKDEHISLLGDTQPGYGLFLEGMENTFRSGTIEYIQKNKGDDTEQQFIKKTLIKKLMEELDKNNNYLYNWKQPSSSKKQSHLRANDKNTFSKKIEKAARTITGTFYIYTIGNPCVFCMETYYKLINFFPKINFNVYYSLSAEEDSKLNNDYTCQIKQFKESEWFQDSMLKKYSDIPDIKIYQKILNQLPSEKSRVNFQRIFPHSKYEGLLEVISKAMSIKKSAGKKEDDTNNCKNTQKEQKNLNSKGNDGLNFDELRKKVQALEKKYTFLENSLKAMPKKNEMNKKNKENSLEFA